MQITYVLPWILHCLVLSDFTLSVALAVTLACASKNYIPEFTWPMTTHLELNIRAFALPFNLLTCQLEEQRNAKNVSTVCFKLSFTKCGWPPTSRLVCKLAFAHPQLIIIIIFIVLSYFLDLTDKSSFERAKYWVNELKTYEEVSIDTHFYFKSLNY